MSSNGPSGRPSAERPPDRCLACGGWLSAREVYDGETLCAECRAELGRLLAEYARSRATGGQQASPPDAIPAAGAPVNVYITGSNIYIVTALPSQEPPAASPPPPSRPTRAVGSSPRAHAVAQQAAPVSGRLCPHCQQRTAVLHYDPKLGYLYLAGTAVLTVVVGSLAEPSLALLAVALLLAFLVGLGWAVPKLRPPVLECRSCGYRGASKG